MPHCTAGTASNLQKLVQLTPEFSGKPDEDAEAHLLQTNNWMSAHHFLLGV